MNINRKIREKCPEKWPVKEKRNRIQGNVANPNKSNPHRSRVAA